MHFTLHPSKNLPSESQIVELEKMLQCTLPESYRTFLKKYNDPKLSPLEGNDVSNDACIAIFAKPSDAYEPEWWCVRFIHLTSDEEYWGLRQAYEIMIDSETHLPDLMAFADTGGGVKFHLCVRGERTGGIFMAGDRYTRCIDEGRTPTLKDYTQICENFDAFLDQLRWVSFDRAGNTIVESVGSKPTDVSGASALT